MSGPPESPPQVSVLPPPAHTIDVKLKALACHESQVKHLPYEEWVRRRAAELGTAAGMEFAEGFRTFSFIDRRRASDDSTEQA